MAATEVGRRDAGQLAQALLRRRSGADDGLDLVIARPIILPVMASVIVAYVVLGLAELIGRRPGLRRLLPPAMRYAWRWPSASRHRADLWLIVHELRTGGDALPRYQEQLLGDDPARRGQVRDRRRAELGNPAAGRARADQPAAADRLALRASVASIVATFAVVLIYAGFLLAEKGAFARTRSRGCPTSRPRVAQIRRLIGDINSRIGTYLVMKTLINVLLGVASYIDPALLRDRVRRLLGAADRAFQLHPLCRRRSSACRFAVALLASCSSATSARSLVFVLAMCGAAGGWSATSSSPG